MWDYIDKIFELELLVANYHASINTLSLRLHTLELAIGNLGLQECPSFQLRPSNTAMQALQKGS